ncbi:MAG: sarcosine oxidase subunit gamma [Gammaproteobacteria bacterium]|nr:sarcosine oxidase subunit gamma [Gammaproteobacteria bacterium]
MYPCRMATFRSRFAARYSLIRRERASMSDATPSPQDWLQVLPPAKRYILQGPPAALAAADSALGLLTADVAGRARSNERASVLWLGPDERLLIANSGAASSGHDLESALRGALATQPYSLVDVSHRQLGLKLSCTFAEDLLNCGCPQDLSLTAFPIDMCSRTLFNKTEIVLWRRGVHEFQIEVWRSFAPYLEGWMREAVQDLG